MKLKFPLYAQIVSVFILNLLLLLMCAFFSSEFNFGWDTLVYSPAGDRVQSAAFAIHRKLRSQPEDKWNEVLDQFGDFYDVRFLLFDLQGKQLAGEKVTLPRAVRQRITMPPEFARHGGDRRMMVNATPAGVNRPGDRFFAVNDSGASGPVGRGYGSPDRRVGRDEHLHIFAAPPMPPHLPRFILHTKNPDLCWIGAMVPPLHVPAPGERSFKPPMPGTLIAVTPNIWQTRLVADFGNVALFVTGVFGFSLVVWWPFVHLITRSLGKLTKATEEISEGRFDTVLKVNSWDEIGRLAQAINGMSGKLNAYVSGQKRFLGDIAHELCSPIARLQIALEILDSSSKPEQKAAIEDIREEVEEMSSLINELLAFSRAGIKGPDRQLHAVDLRSILEDALAKTDLDGNCQMNIPDPFGCLGDEVLLKRAFENIFRNAERYAGDAGPVRIDGIANGAEICVTVSDCGPGVPSESIELLGQPFYRPEASRSRSSGGVGLGLAIVKTCVEACDGTFHIENIQPHGLRVEVRLKAADR